MNNFFAHNVINLMIAFLIIILFVIYVVFFLIEKRKKSMKNVDSFFRLDVTNEINEKTMYSIENMKSKNNVLMLSTIPKWICITLCFVSMVYVVGTIVLCALNRNTEDSVYMFQNLAIADFISIGITIVGIAVSVWVGLNIYIAFSKEENEKLVAEMKTELSEAKEESERIRQQSENLKGTVNDLLKENLISIINATSIRYPMSIYLAYLYEKIDLRGLDVGFIRSLIHGESNYITATEMYESERHLNSIYDNEKLRAFYEKILEQFNIIKQQIASNEYRDKVMEIYIKVRIADAIFYRNASCLRAGGKYTAMFNPEDMRKSVDSYKYIKDFLADYPLNKENSMIVSYVDNTIGYTYDLINQVDLDENMERRKVAEDYMLRSVDNLNVLWEDKRARYLRNLGLTYERNDDLEKARYYYDESLKNDMQDYKTWNNRGAIEIKILEKEVGILSRNSTLDQFAEDTFKEYVDALEYAAETCKMAMRINPAFKDPYYKLIQIYTYLYLANKNRDYVVSEAEKKIHMLNSIGFDRGGFKYAYRNFCEALGDITKANEINSSIPANSKNDVSHLRELYGKRLSSEKSKSKL
ncbi:MAG: tetratricopeptide repeat protein [Lachnospiraceae bacterium]|nr:tetratricopeptide repeat protein [Lachnospiraceae bacterium]